MSSQALLRQLAGPLARRPVLALLAASAWPVRGATPGEVPVGGRLPETLLQGLNGPSRKLSEYLGKPLVINVWASWCGPCVQEMRSLERLAWRPDGQALAVIGISTDDHVAAAKGLLQRTNATLSHYIDRNLVLENMLGANRIPLTVLVDADGRVIDKIYGAREWDSAESWRLVHAAIGRTSVARDRPAKPP